MFVFFMLQDGDAPKNMFIILLVLCTGQTLRRIYKSCAPFAQIYSSRNLYFPQLPSIFLKLEITYMTQMRTYKNKTSYPCILHISNNKKPTYYPQKIFSDNLTNIDTNSKKKVRIFGGGSMTTKTSLFSDPCFAQFSEAQPKMTNTKPMSQNREAAPITNQSQTILQTYIFIKN